MNTKNLSKLIWIHEINLVLCCWYGIGLYCMISLLCETLLKILGGRNECSRLNVWKWGVWEFLGLNGKFHGNYNYYSYLVTTNRIAESPRPSHMVQNLVWYGPYHTRRTCIAAPREETRSYHEISTPNQFIARHIVRYARIL